MSFVRCRVYKIAIMTAVDPLNMYLRDEMMIRLGKKSAICMNVVSKVVSLPL